MTPDFEDVVDVEEAGADAERLRRIHDLLVQAGPPPELEPGLQTPPRPFERRVVDDLEERRRRRRAPALQFGGLRYLAAAAAIAAVAFGVGRATARHADEFASARTVAFRATAAAPHATAELEIGSASHGNWPMHLTATALPTLRGSDYYAVFLTRGGKVVGPCGYFHVRNGRADAYLNAPYELSGAGWIVTRQHRGDRTLGPVVLKTTV